MQSEDREFDQLIDAALASYADPRDVRDEKLLAHRTMAFIHASGKPRRRWWWIALTVPAPACLLILALFTSTRQLPSLKPVTHLTVSPQLYSPPIQRATAKPLRVSLRRAPKRKQPLPKLAIFPTPQPPTATELTLLRFAQNSTVSEKQAILLARRKTTEAVAIADIHMPPFSLN